MGIVRTTDPGMRAKVRDMAAITMIGDGVLSLVRPKRHMRRWKGGPSAWNRTVEAAAQRPMLIRVAGLVTAAAGIWLGARRRRGTL